MSPSVPPCPTRARHARDPVGILTSNLLIFCVQDLDDGYTACPLASDELPTAPNHARLPPPFLIGPRRFRTFAIGKKISPEHTAQHQLSQLLELNGQNSIASHFQAGGNAFPLMDVFQLSWLGVATLVERWVHGLFSQTALRAGG